MRLVADAKVLLSAAIGGQAKAVLEHPAVESVVTTAAKFEEVQAYASHLAQKKRLDLELVLLAVATLPVTIVTRERYKSALARARRKIGKRDPDDVEILMLALHLGRPLWSNDNDFEAAGIEWYTTAELLRRLSLAESLPPGPWPVLPEHGLGDPPQRLFAARDSQGAAVAFDVLTADLRYSLERKK